MDTIHAFFSQPTARRLLLLTLFLGALYVFQTLLIMLAAFTVFVKLFDAAQGTLRGRFGMSPRRATAAVLIGTFAMFTAVGAGAWFQVSTAIEWLGENWHGVDELLDSVGELPGVATLLEPLGGLDGLRERIADEETLSHMANGTLSVMSSGKTALLELVMAFFLALLYVLDRAEVDALRDRLPRGSIAGTLVRWVGHVGDAFALTIQLQVLVAVCNATLTLPFLWWMDVPYLGPLTVFIFVAALVPVIGNYVAALVVCALAWGTSGWIALPVFLGLAVALGKLESFYLSPKLAARHVALPAFVLTLSLVVFEITLGFVGLFLSFPALYVFIKVRDDLRDNVPLPEEDTIAA